MAALAATPLFTAFGTQVTAATLLSTVATVAGAAGAVGQGASDSAAANYQAAQYDQQAGQERAKSQRVAEAKRREATLANSRLQAVAAASGGGATDPTVSTLASNIAGEGEYNALMALFEGEDTARGLEMGAQSMRYKGKQARRKGYINAGSTLVGGATSFFDKYKPA